MFNYSEIRQKNCQEEPFGVCGQMNCLTAPKRVCNIFLSLFCGCNPLDKRHPITRPCYKTISIRGRRRLVVGGPITPALESIFGSM